jgi:hypothetical protein
MVLTAAFHGQKKEIRAAIPASSSLDLHDRDWVYVPASGNKFRPTKVAGGGMFPNKMQEIVFDAKLCEQVVSDALVPQYTSEQ